ncbi:hypothetical protein ACWOFR_08615 [Carnobacterium gallinarum]|uniref:hypothetical protein n=1 Tax=Carnobacterium gallinarum TaxID=2749 RepID=UPI000ADB0A11|nr:hypothetical protein [Carnobacterium gallinarum]
MGTNIRGISHEAMIELNGFWAYEIQKNPDDYDVDTGYPNVPSGSVSPDTAKNSGYQHK